MWTKIPVQQCERLIPSYHESFLTQGQVSLDTTNKKKCLMFINNFVFMWVICLMLKFV